ncbi:NACHT, LRR and PYD domains-containing protein 3-like isoform X2 [Lampetra fluviatilis]
MAQMAVDMPVCRFLRQHRVELESCLSRKPLSVLTLSDERGIVQPPEYRTLNRVKDPREQMRQLIDRVTAKEESDCRSFVAHVLTPLCCTVSGLDAWFTRNESMLATMGFLSVESCILKIYKEYLKERTSIMRSYDARPTEHIPIKEQCVEPILVTYDYVDENKQHESEVRLNAHENIVQRMKRDGFKHNQLFDPIEEERPLIVLLVGTAGSGKTTMSNFIVHRLLSGEPVFSCSFQYVIYIRFRDLNHYAEETTLREVFVDLHNNLGDEADTIFSNAKETLFVMDGLDEFAKPLDFQRPCSDPNSRRSVEAILAGLLEGRLLTGASFLVTTRPIALQQLASIKIKRSSEIMGFSPEEREKFFCKFLRDEALGRQAHGMLQQYEILSILCCNPAFCQIAAITLKSYLKDRKSDIFMLTSMTDLFTKYTFVLVRHHNDGCGGRNAINAKETIRGLANMAFKGVQENNQLFSEMHLQEFSIDSDRVQKTFLSEIFKCEGVIVSKSYSFSHLTIQEYFASLAVYLPQPKLSVPAVIEEIERCSDGRFDIFQKFFTGLASRIHWKTLAEILDRPSTDSQREIIQWLKRRVTASDPNKRRLISLLHCLYELQDPDAIREIMQTRESLDLSHTPLSPFDCTALSYVLQSRNRPLEKLNLWECGISDKELVRLQPTIQRCHELWFGSESFGDNGVELMAKNMEESSGHLQALIMDSCCLTSKSIPALWNIITLNPNLKKLMLSGNDLGDKAMEDLAQEMQTHPMRLEQLYLNKCSLTDKSIPALHQILTTNNCFDWVSLIDNKFSPEGNSRLKDMEQTGQLYIQLIGPAPASVRVPQSHDTSVNDYNVGNDSNAAMLKAPADV